MKNRAIILLAILMMSLMPMIAHIEPVGAIVGSVRGCWHLDEGAGSTAYDSSGNNNHGTVYGGAMWTDGKVGKALEFDGVDDYVEVPDSDSLDITGKITLEAWIYPHTMTDLQIIAAKYNHSAPYNGAYYLGLGGYGYMNKILFALSNDGYHFYYMLSNENITANTWTHVAATSNGTHMILYINHMKDKVSTYAPGVIYASDAPLRIGCYLPELGFPRFFDGIIDEVKVSAATIWTVDDDKAECPTADFTDIQSAVDTASSCDTIYVYPGMYNERVTVNKADLTLLSVQQHAAVIKPTTTPSSWLSGAVLITADGVTIDGFEVDGSTVCDNGINAYGASDVTISNNIVHNTTREWDGMGIAVWDWSGDAVDNALIEKNTIYNTGRMGILILDYDPSNSEYDVTENNTVHGNTVYSTWQVGWGDDGGGIQINVGKGCSITDNLVYNTENGRWGIYMFGSASGNTITGNTLRDNQIGIGLWISGEGGSAIDWEGDTATSPEVNYNNIYDNTNYGATSYNVQGATMKLNAKFNWWGDASGPYHNDTNLMGLGDKVSGNVTYSPWFGFVTGTSPMTYHVNPTGKIQDAIDDASPSDTVKVHEGTYAEQLIINKTLTLQGDPGPRIVAPDTRNTYTIAESSATWDPIIFAYGGTESGGTVSGSGTIDVTINGFEIDGGNKAGSDRYVGILYRNVNPGVVSENVIHDMYDADGEGDGPQTFGIMVYGDSDVAIEYNEVRNFSRGGIGVSGDAGVLPDPTATVGYNTVLGNGLETGSGWWAENGIQIGWGAGGSVIENNVSDCQVNNPSWASTGIMAYDAADGIQILDNTVADCDVGIAAISPSYDLVDGNTVSGCTWDGIRLGWPVNNCTVSNNIVSGNWAGIGIWDASDNTIQNNIIENNEYGIYMDGDSNNNAILDNDILNNTVDGIHVEPYGGFDPSGTEVHCNRLVDNGICGINKTGTETVDATWNWWGSDTGPYHPTTNPGGTGDRVSDNVDYDPWKTYPTLRVEPGLVAGQLFEINVTMNDLHADWKVIGLQFKLHFNGSILQVLNVTEGPFLEQFGDTFFMYFIEDSDTIVGTLLLPNATGDWPGPFPAGSGTLATIIFNGTGRVVGKTCQENLMTDLQLEWTKLIDPENNQIPHYTEDGTYIYTTLLGDVNFDDIVDISDVAAIARAYGETAGRPRWNPDYDLTCDEVIDISDLATAARNFGKTW